MRNSLRRYLVPLYFLMLASSGCVFPSAETRRVWEKIEITLAAEDTCPNPYTDVEVWADLRGPGFNKRCYGFWDGGNTFKIRILATAPGAWTWKTGASMNDPGLTGKSGNFLATGWSENEKEENPNRRGMIRASANGHAFEYADGAPFFLLGDTWWAAATFRFSWRDSDEEYPIGPSAGFKDYVRYRHGQGFNTIALISSFANWKLDDKCAIFKTADLPHGGIIREAWREPGGEHAKDMHDENGNTVFSFPGTIPGYENYFPDINALNPEYFRNFDRKIDYLNARGMMPFIEVTRRDIGQAWKTADPGLESYVRYIRYIYARYQANICLYSPIHLDWTGNTIPVDDWNAAANRAVERYGPPPFGTPQSCNSSGSSLFWFDHRSDGSVRTSYQTDRVKPEINTKSPQQAKWITFHQTGNWREHKFYGLLTDIFRADPPLPAINGEPYYDGMPDAEGGSEEAALYCRSCMYGSVLSGGFGGHIYGAGGWDGGLWGGNVEEKAQTHIWDVMPWQSASHMRHLGAFILSAGERYRELVPADELLTPNRTGSPEGYTGWAFCARTDDAGLFLLYFEKDCPRASLAGLKPETGYTLSWFDPRSGEWMDGATVRSGSDGVLGLPPFPGNGEKSADDWGLKIMTGF